MSDHLFPPIRSRKRRPRAFLRPERNGPQCDNLLRHREGPVTRCAHKGRRYRVNGFLEMALCICCAKKSIRREGVTLKLVRSKKK